MSTTAYQTLQQNASIGRVRLTPSAISFHPDGPAAHDDQWLPTVCEDGVVQLQNCSTGHFWRLAPSDVVSVVPDSAARQDGLVHLRVVLRGQLGLQGVRAGWVPRSRAWRRVSVRPRAA